MATQYKYLSGAFSVTYDPPGAQTAVDLGTTESGIEFSAEMQATEITEDRYGATVMDSLFQGISSLRVSFVSQVWRTVATKAAPLFAGAGFWLGAATDPAQATWGTVPLASYGASFLATLAATGGTLTLTAITGRLLGAAQALIIQAPKAVPMGDLSLLLTLRRPTSVPFNFRLFPDSTELASTGAIKFFTTTWDDNNVTAP